MQKRYKIIGEILLIVPIGLLVLLGLGELTGGIISGLQHFLQLLPLLLLAIGCWFYPKAGGTLLISLSTVLAILYFFTFPLPLLGKLTTIALLFALPILAGCMFVLADREKDHVTSKLQ